MAIMMKPKRVLLLGYPYFVDKLQELGSDSRYCLVPFPKKGFRMWLALLRSDLVYLIGGDLRPNRFYRVALLLRKKLIFHWVGSDILAMQDWRNQGKRFAPAFVKRVTHWAEVDWTARELAALDIPARVIPLTPATFPESVKELPEKFVALTYLPPEKAGFYGESLIIQLAKAFPDVTFLAVGTAPTARNSAWPGNLVSVGWVGDMAELYREVSVLIRLTQHDGLSFMVLEALANARYVIWSYSFDGVFQANDYSRLEQVFRDLYQEYRDGKLQLNYPGRERVMQFYNPQAVWERISRGMDEVLVK